MHCPTLYPHLAVRAKLRIRTVTVRLPFGLALSFALAVLP